MDRLSILLTLATGAVITGGLVTLVLSLGWVAWGPILGAVAIGWILAWPAAWWISRRINGTLRAALTTARVAALSEHVIEWAGGPVKSIKRGFARAVKDARLEDVTPHVLRHTAAVHMAAAGVSMSKIAQYLGHTSTEVTERVYARFAPDHMRDAAEVLDFGKLRPVRRTGGSFT